MPKIKPGPKKSLLDGVSKRGVQELESQKHLAFTFKHLDPLQGQRLLEWENSGLLSQMIDRFKSFELLGPPPQCFNKQFKQYDSFPPESEFEHPKQVPPDAVWASLHLAGKPCVAGHMIGNMFFVVFLDKDHLFWPVEKKHT